MRQPRHWIRESERYIQNGFRADYENQTTLVIAHRLSTIKRANKIMVINQGRIVEQGNSSAIIGLRWPLCQLYRVQKLSVDNEEVIALMSSDDR